MFSSPGRRRSPSYPIRRAATPAHSHCAHSSGEAHSARRTASVPLVPPFPRACAWRGKDLRGVRPVWGRRGAPGRRRPPAPLFPLFPHHSSPVITRTSRSCASASTRSRTSCSNSALTTRIPEELSAQASPTFGESPLFFPVIPPQNRARPENRHHPPRICGKLGARFRLWIHGRSTPGKPHSRPQRRARSRALARMSHRPHPRDRRTHGSRGRHRRRGSPRHTPPRKEER